ncbi:serine/threonine-protein kinase [Nocardiopsis sp. CT-R113]|uniref:Serine/threonine-protein kinase n=1 Tax=Nocardiopsis codii TaxID=3065942 RepID=A0ABU7K276_9ACTN|nr:serine/threonine-protein kinase [Nocardiopsis sp. CT-R113]MEE2036350.1 serine/threonine-protein kinase [Nocardiopsis sp. CT-R113]
MSAPPSPAGHGPVPPPLPEGVAPLAAGEPDRVGPFRLVGRLGAGGMGVVYAALDDDDNRVAVKCVHRTFAADPDFRSRFAREVSLVRRVRAACVPRFLGADTEADLPWLASEYVPGLTLDAHVRARGALTGPHLTAFACGVAEALGAVHAEGVVHRDLKPGNVILAPDGPKVLDFGIARAVEETALTRTGGLVGTPGWIAPEQYLGQDAGPHSDMFAWAGLVAFAATGRGPFGAGGPDVMASRILSDPPELDGVPADLRGLLARALDKDPGGRPDAAGAMAATAALLREGPGTADADGADRAMGRAWSGVSAEPGGGIELWRAHAPRRRPWAVRHRTPLAVASAAVALVVLAGTGAGYLAAGEGAGEGPGQGGEDPAGGTGTTSAGAGPGDASGQLDGAPAAYRDLYENGSVVVEPSSEAPVLTRTLVPEGGDGEPLDQLSITFASDGGFSNDWMAMAATVEYLPDFGEIQLRTSDFGWVDEIRPEHGSLEFERQGAGLAYVLSPRNPTVELPMIGIEGIRTRAVYYLPSDVADAEGRVAVDYSGGFCLHAADGGATFPGGSPFGPHDLSPVDGVLANSCVHRGGA